MILQTDPGWLPERRGRLTASRMADAMAFLKNGKESEARRKLKGALAAERMADFAVDNYVSPAMKRGLELEQPAKDAFEAYTGLLLGDARLFHHPTIEWFSATPDATVGADKLAEFKVPLVETYTEWLREGVVPEQHKPQLLAQLAVTRRQSTYFVAYCPEMSNPEKRLFIRHFKPTPEEIEAIEKAAIQFLKEVDELFEATVAAENVEM